MLFFGHFAYALRNVLMLFGWVGAFGVLSHEVVFAHPSEFLVMEVADTAQATMAVGSDIASNNADNTDSSYAYNPEFSENTAAVQSDYTYNAPEVLQTAYTDNAAHNAAEELQSPHVDNATYGDALIEPVGVNNFTAQKPKSSLDNHLAAVALNNMENAVEHNILQSTDDIDDYVCTEEPDHDLVNVVTCKKKQEDEPSVASNTNNREFIQNKLSIAERETIVKHKIQELLHNDSFSQDPEVQSMLHNVVLCDNRVLVWDKCFSVFYGQHGTVRSLTTYINGQRSGPYQAYYGDGTLRVAKTFAHGLEVGVTKHYSTNGSLVSEQTFTNGRLNGVSRSFYDNGQLKDEKFYENGQLDGALVEFFQNGQVKTQANYKHNRLHGSFKQYFSNGQLFIENEYNNGLQNGIYRRFDISGEILAETEFLEGKRSGMCFVYGPYNVVLLSVEFFNDQAMHGRCGLSGRQLSQYELKEFVTKSMLPKCTPETLPSDEKTPLGYQLKLAKH